MFLLNQGRTILMAAFFFSLLQSEPGGCESWDGVWTVY
jgi:hypothetical protein